MAVAYVHGGAMDNGVQARWPRRLQESMTRWSSTPSPGTTATATGSGAGDSGQGGDRLGWLLGQQRCGGTGKQLRHGERELAQRLHRWKEVAEDMLTTEELVGGTQLTGTIAGSTATDGS
jgi:hypothetical protein